VLAHLKIQVRSTFAFSTLGIPETHLHRPSRDTKGLSCLRFEFNPRDCAVSHYYSSDYVQNSRCGRGLTCIPPPSMDFTRVVELPRNR